MHISGLLFFSIALNLDALGIGISYGIRKITIPFLSMIIICMVSMSAISFSMAMGHMMGHYIPARMVKDLGGGILLLLGIWAIIQYFCQAGGNDTPPPELNETTAQLLELHFMGLVIRILKQPHLIDIDNSGIISGNEALLLGLALSVDALTAGIAISLLGYRILNTAVCIGAGQFLFLNCGALGGKQLEKAGILKSLAILPGLILIVLGLSRFY